MTNKKNKFWVIDLDFGAVEKPYSTLVGARKQCYSRLMKSGLGSSVTMCNERPRMDPRQEKEFKGQTVYLDGKCGWWNGKDVYILNKDGTLGRKV